MKILEVNNDFKIECICTGYGNGNIGCGSKLLVEKEDIYLTHYNGSNNEEVNNYTFRCPVCGCETDIKDIQIPIYIKRELLDKSYKYKRLKHM